MNKKILKVTIVAIFALVAGTNVYNALKPEPMSDIALANVEALAGSEIRCVDVLGGTLFYCISNEMFSCYCDGACPGRGYKRVHSPEPN